MKFVSGRPAFLMALLALGVCSSAYADIVALGSDYFQTALGSIVIGGEVVNLAGDPIGLGPTDAIVQRKADATIGGAAIPIQMTVLSLESTAPVNFGGSFFDVFVTLDPANLSKDTGTMSINGSLAGGTFTSSLDVFVDVHFVPTAGGSKPDEFTNFFMTNPGSTWKPTYPIGATLMPGLDCDPTFAPCSSSQMAADQAANYHKGLASNEVDFFSAADVRTPTNVVLPAPEPGSLSPYLCGVVAVGALVQRRRKTPVLQR